MRDFMNRRFGMFIHWGPVSLRGTEIGWSRGKQVATEDYDNLYREFNPVLFNADSWALAAKNAGMKYLVITAKHHDGFCLWPSATTTYDIASSPFKRDVVGELAAACKKHGIAFCIYFSVLDWHDEDYPVRISGDSVMRPNANMRRFTDRMKAQLTELITQYHPYMLWFDGDWEKPWTTEYAREVYAHIKKLDKQVIVNNRLGKGTHKVMTAETVGEYATPEQFVGEMNMRDPWESCITIAQQWAWKPNDKMKTLKQSLQILLGTAGGNGNLLYNVGPMLDGRIEARQTDMLAQMGNWLGKYGEAVYGTQGGPFKANKNFAATRKGNRIYIHLFNQDTTALLLPAIPGRQVKQVHFLKGADLKFSQSAQGINVALPAAFPDKNVSVIVLEMDGNTAAIEVID
jgi:alpha-L-fucosidase